MSIEITISKINRELISGFAVLDSWFDRQEAVLHEPSSGGWSAPEILEHVMLTNRHLLILIKKGTKRALAIAVEKDLSQQLQQYTFENPALEEIADPDAFPWQRPDHMVPTSGKPLNEIREALRDQLYQCLCILDLLQQGQGIAYRITMSVNELGKLDIYQYIYFLALHVKRHIRQLEKLTIGNLSDMY